MGVEPGEPSEEVLMKVQCICQRIHQVINQYQLRAERILTAMLVIHKRGPDWLGALDGQSQASSQTTGVTKQTVSEQTDFGSAVSVSLISDSYNPKATPRISLGREAKNNFVFLLNKAATSLILTHLTYRPF